MLTREFPGVPVVRTPRAFTAEGQGSNPDRGTNSASHAHGQKKKNANKTHYSIDKDRRGKSQGRVKSLVALLVGEALKPLQGGRSAT